MRDYGDTRAIVSINKAKFVIDDAFRLVIAGISMDYSKRKTSQYYFKSKNLGEISELMKSYPKLDKHNFQ